MGDSYQGCMIPSQHRVSTTLQCIGGDPILAYQSLKQIEELHEVLKPIVEYCNIALHRNLIIAFDIMLANCFMLTP